MEPELQVSQDLTEQHTGNLNGKDYSYYVYWLGTSVTV